MSAPTTTSTRRRALAVPAAAIAAVALVAGVLMMGPFWFNTGVSVAADRLPPGSAALFTGGILLLVVNARFQWQVGRRVGWHPQQVGLLVFLLAMTAGNLAIIVEMVADNTPWTRWDSTWMVAAFGSYLVLLLWLRHSPVRDVAGLVSAALAGRVAIQAAIAVWELAYRVSMPGVLLAFIGAFGACRLVPVWVQWHSTRQPSARALVVTETANAATVLLLAAAWVAAR